MIAMVVILIVGLLCILAGSSISRRNIRRTFGAVDTLSIKMSEGTGVVPRSVSLLVLAGWLALIVGAIGVVVTAAS